MTTPWRRERTLLAVLVLCLLLVLWLPACGSKKEATPLRLGLLPIEDNFPFFVAAEENLFARYGLNVELVPFNSARDRDMALAAGRIDGETADPIAVALLRKAGTAVKIVALTMGTVPEEGRFALLAAPTSGIKAPQDLIGKSVAVSENTIIEYVADQLLLAAGLDPKQVKKVPVPDMPQRLQLLVHGQVDAAVLPDPLASLAAKQGAMVILDDTRQKENFSQVVLVFREETIEHRLAELTRLLAVYKEAAGAVAAKPEAYRALFVEYAKIPEALKETYLAPRYAAPALPRPAELERAMQWMVTKGLLPTPYSYGELVEERVLRDLKQ